MLPYLVLMRPLNAVMSVFAVLIGGLLVAGNNPPLLSNLYPLATALVVVFLISGAGNAINDYIDVDSDRINRPGRPIPSGRVSRGSALALSATLFLAGILLSLLISWLCFIIALINSILLVVYSWSLQDRILLGNMVIGYLVGSTFLFGGASFGDLLLPGLLMLLAGLSTVSREIVKDLEDIAGDRKSFMKKLAAGVKIKLSRFVGKEEAGLAIEKGKARAAALAFMLLALIISPLPYLLNILGSAYLIVLVPTDIVFLLSMAVLYSRGRRKYSRSSRLIKAGMILGLMAFICGVLF
jgi:geranylgeranylglycerol-phosphate geranylgeranyltransferase